MSWQDELRRLDEDMAAGRVSTDDYRRRYDELTTQGREQRSATEAPAEAPADAQPETTTGAQADTAAEPQVDTKAEAQADTRTEARTETGAGDRTGPDSDVGPGNTATAEQGSGAEQPKDDERSGPFPPAFRWDNPSPNETTQVIEPLPAGDRPGDAERTQVVRTPTQPPPGPQHDDSERTQVVQVPPPAPSPYEQPTYQRDAFSTGPSPAAWTPQESTPPWVSSDLPPIPEPNAGWMMQGPEFFEPEQKPSGTGRIVAIVAAVVVLAGIVVGAVFLFQPSDPVVPTTSGAAPQQPPPQASPTSPPTPQSLAADLPGQVKDTSALQNSSQLSQLAYLDEQELDVLSGARSSEAAFALSEDNGTKLIILVVQNANAAAASDQLADLQVQFALRTISGGHTGVRVAGGDNAAETNPVVRRAHYASGDYVVRVEASGSDVGAVQTLFQSILASQLERLPADG